MITSNANSHVVVTINGVSIKVPQGQNSFQDLLGRALRVQAAPANAVLCTVNSNPVKPTSFNANGSFSVDGGESFTFA